MKSSLFKQKLIIFFIATAFASSWQQESLSQQSINPDKKPQVSISESICIHPTNAESTVKLREIITFENNEERYKILECYLAGRQYISMKYTSFQGTVETLNTLLDINSLDSFILLSYLEKRGSALKLREEAFISIQQGDFKQAIKLLENALQEYEYTNNYYIDDVLFLLSDLGQIYLQLGQYNKTNEVYQKAVLNIAKYTPKSQVRLLNSLGNSKIIEGSYLQAVNFYKRALDIARHHPDMKNLAGRSLLSETLTGLGYVYAQRNFHEDALEYLYESLDINFKIGDALNDLKTLNNIAQIYELQGKDNEAFLIYNYIVEASQSIISASTLTHFQMNSEIEKYKALSYQINLRMRYKLFNEAEKDIVELIDFFEHSRSTITDNHEQIFFFDTYSRHFAHLQKIIISKSEKENFKQALEITEKGRARSLVELLNRRFPSEQLRSQSSITELQAIAQEHNSTIVTYSVIPTEIQPREWVDTDLYIWVIKPNGNIQFRQVDLTQYPRPLSELVNKTLQNIRETPDIQPTSFPQEIALNYEPNQRGSYDISELAIGDLIFISQLPPEPWKIEALNQQTNEVTFSNSTETRTLPVNRVLKKVTIKTPITGGDPTLIALHNLLINPIVALLPTDPSDKVIFIPQDELFSVPFPALQDEEGVYLIDKHTILTAPSIQVLAQTQAQRQRIASLSNSLKPALIIGNPYPYQNDNISSLEHAANEAKEIAQLLNIQPILGKKANEEKILKEMSKANILHFATHATFDNEDGLNSAILLTAEPGAEDDGIFTTPGRITAAEIFETFNEKNPLNADLVVLSACDTGQGEITGDGVVGLSRSLISGGVPSVLVSLWSVDDASTGQLMTEFYDQWQGQGVDKATALRNAMLETRQSYPTPYYWAAFTLIGEAE